MRRKFWGKFIQLAIRMIYRQHGCSGCPRVLHLHVRKTAGTSFNFGFLRQMTSDPEELYESTAHKLIKCSQTSMGPYCAWDPALAATGRYVFCHTHAPVWQFDVPDDVFVVTILRDPLARLSSLHAMLRLLVAESPGKHALRREVRLYRDDFLEFVRSLPDEELMGQVYKFSRNFDLTEALANLRAKVDLIGSTDGYAAFISNFNEMTGYELPILHLRGGQKDTVSYTDLPVEVVDRLAVERDFVSAAIKQTCGREPSAALRSQDPF